MIQSTAPARGQNGTRRVVLAEPVGAVDGEQLREPRAGTIDPALDRPYRALADRSRLVVGEARRADEKQGLATVTSDIVDVLELGKPPLWCVPSTKVYVKRFSMPAGALVAAPVGARFHLTLARCQRLDSHCLRAHCAIKHPRVSTDHLVRQTMLQRHDDPPPGKPRRWRSG